jgi:hypothetical protein
VHYHDFASLLAERNVRDLSPEFEGLGRQWCLKLYPGGDGAIDEGMVSIVLSNKSKKAIELDYGFVNDGN